MKYEDLGSGVSPIFLLTSKVVPIKGKSVAKGKSLQLLLFNFPKFGKSLLAAFLLSFPSLLTDVETWPLSLHHRQ